MKFITSLLPSFKLGTNQAAAVLSEEEMGSILGGNPAAIVADTDYWWID